MENSAIVTKEEDWYVAKDINSSIASQGKTKEEALENLKEALALYHEGEEVDEN